MWKGGRKMISGICSCRPVTVKNEPPNKRTIGYHLVVYCQLKTGLFAYSCIHAQLVSSAVSLV